ncbi:MAG: cupin domain-containing protein [Nitrospirota bacterium]|nr:cupin domain-containing protein [Nitrospirota bacterium]
MNDRITHTPNLSWAQLFHFPGNAEVKVLRDEGPGEAMTLLVRLPPGGQIRPHSHPAPVQHYVLEGTYESEGDTFHAGTYRFIVERKVVATLTTTTGALILMIYDPVTLPPSEVGSSKRTA